MWQKPGTMGHILPDPKYIKYLKQVNYLYGEKNELVIGSMTIVIGAKWRLTGSGYGAISVVIKMFQK